jgi:hypothetical protein
MTVKDLNFSISCENQSRICVSDFDDGVWLKISQFMSDTRIVLTKYQAQSLIEALQAVVEEIPE